MPLINFGSILSFAEEIEKQQFEFYNQVSALPQSAELTQELQTLSKAAKKRISEVQRVRRENVTEMILETIDGFFREPFLMENRIRPTCREKKSSLLSFKWAIAPWTFMTKQPLNSKDRQKWPVP